MASDYACMNIIIVIATIVSYHTSPLRDHYMVDFTILTDQEADAVEQTNGAGVEVL